MDFFLNFFKFKDDPELLDTIYTGDMYYDLFEGGGIDPYDYLITSQAERVSEALNLIEDFLSALEALNLLEEC